MKLKFKNQEFQNDAVNAVADLFDGQEKSTMTFSIDNNGDQLRLIQNNFGLGNKLEIDNDTLISNMHNIQRRHKLPISRDYEQKQYSIEMETGTGKSFVYIKTILELNKRYGFTKFIVVVPSVAIREGAYKSFQVTEEYLKNQKPKKFFIKQKTFLIHIMKIIKSISKIK